MYLHFIIADYMPIFIELLANMNLIFMLKTWTMIQNDTKQRLYMYQAKVLNFSSVKCPIEKLIRR